MPSVQYKMVETLFKTIGVRNMLDKEGADFQKLLDEYNQKQKKPLKIPYNKLEKFVVSTRMIGDTTCHVIRENKSASPKRAILYLFGGGYILAPDPGDLILCGQMAEQCDAEVWFPLYPMAPSHKLVETVESTRGVYLKMLEQYDAENIRFFGTSSGGGLALSLCMYIRHEHYPEPLPGKLVLQSPGLQVPPSAQQREWMEQHKHLDVMIPPAFFDRIAPVLATGEDAYLLSPLLFDLTDFPPVDIFYGTQEVMIAYLKPWKRACQKYGVPLQIHVGKGMMHCWGAMEFVPEARAVRRAYFKALQ